MSDSKITSSENPQTPAQSLAIKNRLPDLALLGVALIWGINVPVFKHAIEIVDAFHFNATRLVFSAITLAVFSALTARRFARSVRALEVEKKTKSKKPNFGIRVIAFCLITGLIYQLFFLFGMSRTTSGNAALILSSMPMWTAMIAFLFIRERLGKFEWIGLSITLIGTLIIVFQNEGIGFSLIYFFGNVLMICAAIFWSVGTVVAKTIFQRQKISPIFLAFLACALTVPIHLVVANMLTPFPREMFQPDVLACVVYSGVLSTGCSYALWNYGVSKVGASHASVFQNLVPVFTIFVAYFWKSEIPVIAQYLGGGLIIGGLVVMRRNSTRKLDQDSNNDLTKESIDRATKSESEKKPIHR